MLFTRGGVPKKTIIYEKILNEEQNSIWGEYLHTICGYGKKRCNIEIDKREDLNCENFLVNKKSKHCH